MLTTSLGSHKVVSNKVSAHRGAFQTFSPGVSHWRVGESDKTSFQTISRNYSRLIAFSDSASKTRVTGEQKLYRARTVDVMKMCWTTGVSPPVYESDEFKCYTDLP